MCSAKAFGEITLNEYRTEPGDAKGSGPGPCSPGITALGTSCHLGEAERAAIAQKPRTDCAGRAGRKAREILNSSSQDERLPHHFPASS